MVTEITDHQLKRLSKDKSAALKLIESQTGLKLKKQKKTFYFTGLLYQHTLLNELFSKYPEIIDETESETLSVEPTTTLVSISTATPTKIDFDMHTITYYRQIYDLNFEKLIETLDLKNVFITSQNEAKNLSTFNYKASKSDVQTILTNEFNNLKTKIKIIKLNIKKETKIFDADLATKFKILIVKQQNQDCVLVGMNEDLKSFYDINSSRIIVEQDQYNDKKTTWVVDDQKIDKNLQQKASNNNNNFGPKLTITVNNNSQRIVRVDPFLKLNSKEFCYFCQEENFENLKKCSNKECSIAFCKKCLIKKIQNTKNNKCPNCPSNFGKLKFVFLKQISIKKTTFYRTT